MQVVAVPLPAALPPLLGPLVGPHAPVPALPDGPIPAIAAPRPVQGRGPNARPDVTVLERLRAVARDHAARGVGRRFKVPAPLVRAGAGGGQTVVVRVGVDGLQRPVGGRQVVRAVGARPPRQKAAPAEVPPIGPPGVLPPLGAELLNVRRLVPRLRAAVPLGRGPPGARQRVGRLRAGTSNYG